MRIFSTLLGVFIGAVMTATVYGVAPVRVSQKDVAFVRGYFQDVPRSEERILPAIQASAYARYWKNRNGKDFVAEVCRAHSLAGGALIVDENSCQPIT